MARPQTIFSELHLALSVAGTDKLSLIENVDKDIELVYQKEYAKRIKDNKNRIYPLEVAGSRIRSYLLNNHVDPVSVKWTGRNKLGSFTSVSKDIQVADTVRISVKEDADVFINGSPERVFVDVPQGKFGVTRRGSDWYLRTAHAELNDYFCECNARSDLFDYPDVKSFYDQVPAKHRKPLSRLVNHFHKQKIGPVLSSYRKLCRVVSQNSADIFNKNVSLDRSALVPIFHFFFRINGTPYILAGTESRKPFAVLLPSSDEWVKKYEFRSIEASPTEAGQPEVSLKCIVFDKYQKVEIPIYLRIEVRWSHGKFCGNPEAKVYKMWRYEELPWAVNLMDYRS